MYVLTNALFVIFTWLGWLTYNVRKIKIQGTIHSQQKMKKLFRSKKGWIHWVLVALLVVMLFLYVYYRYAGGQ